VVFDADTIKPRMPTVEQDLPGGAKRLVQKADGIAATVVNGALAFEHGVSTGDFAGQMLKGPLG
jgi:N-acyl-D-aspartate/D-glutamate deacylase